MLFRKDIDPCCAYCHHASKLDEDAVMCKKKGIMPINGRCRKFRYDPLMRTPPKPKLADFSKYDQKDYSL